MTVFTVPKVTMLSKTGKLLLVNWRMVEEKETFVMANMRELMMKVMMKFTTMKWVG